MKTFRPTSVLAVALALGWPVMAPAENFSASADTALKFGVHEIVLTGDGGVANPFDTIATVNFVPPTGEENAKTVHAFYDGDNTWRARVYVSETGDWKWTSRCDTDKGLNGKGGTFNSGDSKLRGRLLIHPKNPRQWMTEDGSWFLNLNDTSYFLLCSHDGAGNAVSEDDFKAYVRDATAHGITSFRSWIANGPKPFVASGNNDNHRWNALFADKGLSRLNLDHLRVADSRLQWLLDEHPDAYLQFILFPLGTRWRMDESFWAKMDARQKERVMRHLIARFAAYPQIFWLVVNDAHYAPDQLPDTQADVVGALKSRQYPNNIAMAREVGAYFKQHDPWRHPLSTGHARTVPFQFGDEDWATYIHLEDLHDLGAMACERHLKFAKPVFLGEDRYENDYPTADPTDMRYFQRRLFWAWLISGGSANYGGRWWPVHPYTQTGQRPTTKPTTKGASYKEQLVGLDSVTFIRDFFATRKIELSDFDPDHALVSDPEVKEPARAPKLMRRGHDEFLIYHPNAADDGRDARADVTKAARLKLDLRAAQGKFAVEWYRAADGVAQAGEAVLGGDWRDLSSPWKGHDCVVRLVGGD
ncbi:MAG: DUF5060 domain-containing protein [Verrucomicrobiales bacterium]|nr:DUF5060 domain-containing protein [Verrucomicrobiales bacterium]